MNLKQEMTLKQYPVVNDSKEQRHHNDKDV
jgi:hypothetical protein